MQRRQAAVCAWVAAAGLALMATLGASHAQAQARLELESTGAELDVWLQPERGPAIACDTPCTLLVTPGRYYLETERRGVRANRTDVEIPAAGAALLMNAGSGAAYAWGIILSIVGAASLVMAGTMVALGFQTEDSYNQMMAGIGGGAGGTIGTVALSLGLTMIFSNQTGVEVVPFGEPAR